MRPLLKVVLLILVNLIIVTLLLELALRASVTVLPPRLAEPARAVMFGSSFPQAWTPAWQINPDHYYILRPHLVNELQYGSPTVSFRLSTIELWEGAGIGFRTRPIDYRVDAVVVGDSFGFCFTEVADCWVTHLETLTDQGMVNLSQPVTGTRSHLRHLQVFGAPLRPPLVIWQFFGNDFNDDYGLAVLREEITPLPDDVPLPQRQDHPLIEWLRHHLVAYAVIETALTGSWGGWEGEQWLYDRPYEVRYGEHVLRFGGLYELQALDMSRERNQIGLGMSRQALQEAQNTVATWGGALVIVLIPTREEIYAHLTMPIMGQERLDTLSSAYDAMLGLCAELNLACFDPKPVLMERALRNEALYFADDMHLNPHGNLVLAQALAQWLAERP